MSEIPEEDKWTKEFDDKSVSPITVTQNHDYASKAFNVKIPRSRGKFVDGTTWLELSGPEAVELLQKLKAELENTDKNEENGDDTQ